MSHRNSRHCTRYVLCEVLTSLYQGALTFRISYVVTVQLISFTPVRKVLPSLSLFTRQTQILNCIICGCLVLHVTPVDKFGKHGQKFICATKQNMIYTIYTAPDFSEIYNYSVNIGSAQKCIHI